MHEQQNSRLDDNHAHKIIILIQSLLCVEFLPKLTSKFKMMINVATGPSRAWTQWQLTPKIHGYCNITWS